MKKVKLKILGKEIEVEEDKTFTSGESTVTKYSCDNNTIFEYKINLKNPEIEKYFNFTEEEIKKINDYRYCGLTQHIKRAFDKHKEKHDIDDEFISKVCVLMDMQIDNDVLTIYLKNIYTSFINIINRAIRDFYSEREMHITRMFGSYILLMRENNELKAVKATPIPIKYCPLMIKLLREVGGDYANEIIETLKTKDEQKEQEAMCNLINEIVIKGGYFDTNRPLNSCEANVLFGASETISSAFKNGLIDAAVIVSNNLGTIITTNESSTQGAVKRMTGLFYTSPSSKLIDTAKSEGIIPIFPYTAKIDQLLGVIKAIERGYKNIAVTVAANDNYLHKLFKKLEEAYNVTIYKFGLCTTGIDYNVAMQIKENADVVWSCASKYVKELIEPNAIAQVGVKIPVHILTKKGWTIVKNHLLEMNSHFKEEDIELQSGDNKPVFLNKDDDIIMVKRKMIKKCNDCPSPCV